MLTKQDIQNIQTMIDETLERKLDEKLDQKFEQFWQRILPVLEDLTTRKECREIVQEEYQQLVQPELVSYDQRIAKLEAVLVVSDSSDLT
jgi:two-component sensor histidine kinase